MSNDVGVLLDRVSEVVAQRIAPEAARIDRERAFPVESVRALGEAGALGLVVPVEYGGAGGALSALAEACEIVGSACASSGMVFLMYSVTAATIAAAGGARAGNVLERLASDAALGTLAFSERGTGAHFYSPELAAVRSNGGVAVTGRKSFVTSGGHADVYLILLQGEAEGTSALRASTRRRLTISPTSTPRTSCSAAEASPKRGLYRRSPPMVQEDLDRGGASERPARGRVRPCFSM
ncbi:MAG: acyl-CoA dehydrogenase family protein [Gaiellaceae bacterium]